MEHLSRTFRGTQKLLEGEMAAVSKALEKLAGAARLLPAEAALAQLSSLTRRLDRFREQVWAAAGGRLGWLPGPHSVLFCILLQVAQLHTDEAVLLERCQLRLQHLQSGACSRFGRVALTGSICFPTEPCTAPP